MDEQLSMFPPLGDGEDAEDLKRQVSAFKEYEKKKRSWENGFQKWSNYMVQGEGSVNGYGCCGYGSMCDWCEDNSYGRPCVRALNSMCREKHITINYEDRDYAKIWNM